MTYPISRYLNIRSAYHPAFAANGRFLAFISDITGIPQAWRVDLDHATEIIPWPDQLTFADGRVMTVQYSPVPGDNRIIYSRDVGGNEKAQLFLLDLHTGEETSLTAGHEEAVHIPGEWSKDGRFFLFAANRRQPGLFDLYLQPLDGGEAQMVWQHEEPGFLGNAVFAPNGRLATVIRMRSSYELDLFEVDLQAKKVRPLTPAGKQVRYYQVCYSRDGRSLYVNTDLESDFMHIARLDLASLTWETLVTPNWDTEMLTLSPNGRYLAYAINKEGTSELEVIDLGMGVARPAPLPAGAPGVVGWFDKQMAFSADSTRLAFSYSSATRTSDIYVWQLETGEITAVTRSAYGGIPVETFVAPELIHYPTFDERQLPAWLYRPPEAGSQPLPVVVIVHGGPESQFRPYFHFLAQYLVQHGYAVLATNVRGSSGYGKTYAHLDNVEKRMDSVADLAHAAHWLKAQPSIDGDRIVVYGGSYGGFMVLAALTTYPDLWKAGVDIVGISNFVTFLENTSDYRRAHREAEYGRLDRDRPFLQSIAPINHVENIRVPLMVIHGANDPRVPLSEAEQLVEALQAQETPVEFLVFDDEGHGIAKLENKLVSYPAIIDFLNKYA